MVARGPLSLEWHIIWTLVTDIYSNFTVRFIDKEDKNYEGIGIKVKCRGEGNNGAKKVVCDGCGRFFENGHQGSQRTTETTPKGGL